MTTDELLFAVGCALGVSVAQLRSRSRKRHIVHARQAAMWAIHTTFPKLSQQSIGDMLGGRDHTTVKYGIDATALRLADDTELFMALYQALPALFVPAPAPRPVARGMAFWAALGRKEWEVVTA